MRSRQTDAAWRSETVRRDTPSDRVIECRRRQAAGLARHAGRFLRVAGVVAPSSGHAAPPPRTCCDAAIESASRSLPSRSFGRARRGIRHGARGRHGGCRSRCRRWIGHRCRFGGDRRNRHGGRGRCRFPGRRCGLGSCRRLAFRRFPSGGPRLWLCRPCRFALGDDFLPRLGGALLRAGRRFQRASLRLALRFRLALGPGRSLGFCCSGHSVGSLLRWFNHPDSSGSAGNLRDPLQQLRDGTRFLHWADGRQDSAPRPLTGPGFDRGRNPASRDEKMQAGQIVALEPDGPL